MPYGRAYRYPMPGHSRQHSEEQDLSSETYLARGQQVEILR
jgi:hypothetical protein